LNFLILDLYDITDLEKKVIYFYKTYDTETFQEEISIWEESKLKNIPYRELIYKTIDFYNVRSIGSYSYIAFIHFHYLGVTLILN